MKKLVSYCRVSTSEQGKSGLGMTAQFDAIKRFAEMSGCEIVAHYEEVISGKYFLHDRPVLQQAFKHAEKIGAIVIVSKLDRLSRSVEMIAGLMNRATFATVEDGLNCPPIQLHIKATIAENERKVIGERTKAALVVAKANGKRWGGVTKNHALSIENSIRTRVAEADAFAQRIKPVIARMRASGMTVQQMAAELNEQGNRTARGGQWHGSTVNNLLRRLGIA